VIIKRYFCLIEDLNLSLHGSLGCFPKEIYARHAKLLVDKLVVELVHADLYVACFSLQGITAIGLVITDDREGFLNLSSGFRDKIDCDLVGLSFL
jgi:hypothetical protein